MRKILFVTLLAAFFILLWGWALRHEVRRQTQHLQTETMKYMSYWQLARAVAVDLDGELARCRQPYDTTTGDSVRVSVEIGGQSHKPTLADSGWIHVGTVDTLTGKIHWDDSALDSIVITIVQAADIVRMGRFMSRDEYLRITGTEHTIPGIVLRTTTGDTHR